MNAKAAEIGMTNSHFVNPHGLHDSSHYTTAMDMAKLTYEALKNPTFRKIVGTYRYTPPVTNVHNPDTKPWAYDPWENSNRLISTSSKEAFAFNDSNGRAIGVKTGYTRAAEGTLVSAAESKDGSQTVITVVLRDTPTGKWSDTITMFMYAFDFYDTINLAKHLTDDVTIDAHVENAASSVVNENLQMLLIPEKSKYITDTTKVIQSLIDSPDRFKMVKHIPTLTAPIEKDAEVGTVDFYLDEGEEPVLTCTLIAAHDVEAIPVVTPEPTNTPAPKKPETTPLLDGEVGIIGYLGYGLFGLVGLLLLITIIITLRRKAKYYQYNVSSRGRHSASRFDERDR
jgi:serine-type D-Ala-D-Ala carboxypeptidase (penicillin-binding protein 5/6)